MSTMKFTEMPYTRPDMEAAKAQVAALTARLTEASDYAAAKPSFWSTRSPRSTS